ncbi:MAG: rhomboid family intramembrane serine protease [Candidatus Aminicenantes bacterium]|nr:rhomboid family intramembrane serine protease [Candidatus Aminicenantes bacterium]MDH5706223.1 rhomboid family intramembrane serine protease [Candidatus Aminicenantes bacterium]
MFIPLKDENPTRRFPIVTVILIALNILIFLYQVFSPQGLEYHVLRMGAIPYEITHFTTVTFFPRISPPLTLLTSMFIHGGILHLFGNMLYLWIFGNNIEDFLGPFRFILFYLISGLGASLIHIAFHPSSQAPMIGASGAIAGVLGAYFLLYPGARVLTLVFIWILPVPAFIILGIWFVAQVMNIGIGGGVAWFAHIGGFLIGLGLLRLYLKKRRVRSWVH